MKNFYKFFMTLIAFAVVGVAQATDYVPEDAIEGIPEDGMTFAQQMQSNSESGLYLRGIGASTKIDDECIYRFEYGGLDEQGRQRVYLVQESSGLYLQYMRVDDGLDMWGEEQNCWYTNNVDEAFLLSVEIQANGTLKFWSQDGENPSGTPTYFGMWSRIPSLGTWISGDWLAFTYVVQLPYEKLFSYVEENYPGDIEGMYVVGDAPGNVSQEAYDALEAAFNAAQDLLILDMDAVTEEMAEKAIADLEAAQELINASVVPVKPGYYYITNTIHPSQGAYVEGSEIWHDAVDTAAETTVEQSKFIWEIVSANPDAETPTFYVRNYYTGTYAGAGASGVVPSGDTPVEYLIRTRLSLVGKGAGFALSPVANPLRSWNRNGGNQKSTTVFWNASGSDYNNSYWYLTAVSDEDIAHLVDAIAQDRLNKELSTLTQQAKGVLNSATYYISDATKDGLFPNALGADSEEYKADGILVSDEQIRTNAPEVWEGAPQGYTSQMVDGKNNTYFHSTWSGTNEHNQDPVLDIDLQKEYNALEAKLEIRVTNNAAHSNGRPKTIVYYGTNDESLLLPKTNVLAEAGVADYEGWTELGTTTINSYPYANAEGAANVVALTGMPFGEGNNYRYLRLRFVDNQNKSGAGTSNGWKYICMSELRLYEVTVVPASPVNKVSAATLAELKAQINAARAQLAAQTATQTQIDALQAALDAFIAELNSIIAQDRLNKELSALTQQAKGALNSATYYISDATKDGIFPNAFGADSEEYKADGILVNDEQLSTNAPEANEGAPQGYTSQMVDGKNDTYFHSTWSGANEHNQDPVLDIDLQKEYNALEAKLEIRIWNGASHTQGWPHTIVYYGTNDADLLLQKANSLAEADVADYEGWKELGTTTINTYPYANAEGVANVVAITGLPFGEGNNYRYLRLRFVDNQNRAGAGTTNGWKYICMSELRLYEATVDPVSPIHKVNAGTLDELKAQIEASRAQLAAQTATQAQIDALQAALDAFIAELNSIVTNVDGLSSSFVSANGNVVYDLSGRRTVNVGKGLYIVDGKKVIVK